VKKFNLLAAVLIVSFAMNLLVGCKSESKKAPQKAEEIQGTVTASGSTALLPIMKLAQQEFQKKHPKVTVNIAGGGSFTGQAQVAAGSVNIGNSDVPLQDNLKDKGLVENAVVGTAFVFIANPNVTVNNLTQQQYADIFTGKITNWKAVGGSDAEITIIHRGKTSGSRSLINNIVLKNIPFTDNAIIQDSNGAVRAAIASTPNAIGYVDVAYVDQSVKPLAYNGEEFSIANVVDGKYPVYSFGYIITKAQPTDAVKAFIDYIKSEEFQDTYVEKNNFIPISKLKK